MSQLPRTPDVAAQHVAMRKLSFLAGLWSGEARIFRIAGDPPVELLQTEHAEYKLDGLLLLIEGIGRNKADQKTVLQALGIISYDDEAGVYQMRAYNDGRYLETDVKLASDGKGLSWGFALGEIRTNSVLRLSDRGVWTELHEITVGAQPPRRFMEIRVSPQR